MIFNICAITLSSVWYIFVAIIALMIMITVHELGHYTVGKLFHFGISEFALGFGPPIFKHKKKNGEIFSVRALPIGGFCAFVGEDEDNPAENAFNNKKPWQRILVLLAGVTFNFIFSMLILGIYFAAVGYNQPVIRTLYESNTPGYVQTLQEGDVVLEVNGKAIYTCTISTNFSRLIAKEDTNTFTVLRDGAETDVQVTKAEFIYFAENGDSYVREGIGVGIGYTPYRFGLFGSLWRGIIFSFQIIGVTLSSIGSIFTGALSVKNNMGGTITAISVIGEAVGNYGFAAFVSLLGIMSASIAFFNVLPLPALDGSRVVFTLIEWIRKKPVKREVEGAIHAVGLILLLCLTVILDVINFS